MKPTLVYDAAGAILARLQLVPGRRVYLVFGDAVRKMIDEQKSPQMRESLFYIKERVRVLGLTGAPLSKYVAWLCPKMLDNLVAQNDPNLAEWVSVLRVALRRAVALYVPEHRRAAVWCTGYAFKEKAIRKMYEKTFDDMWATGCESELDNQLIYQQMQLT